MTEDEERENWHNGIGTLYRESDIKELVNCPPERDLVDWLQAMDAVCTAASGVIKTAYPMSQCAHKTWILRGQEEAEALDRALNRLLPH